MIAIALRKLRLDKTSAARQLRAVPAESEEFGVGHVDGQVIENGRHGEIR